MTRATPVDDLGPGLRLVDMDGRKSIGVLVCGFALALAGAAIAVGAVKPADPAGSARVVLAPQVVRLGQQAGIVVSNVRVRSLQVTLGGATDKVGRPLGWRSLKLGGGSWRGVLPSPALLGIYPILLRVAAGSAPFGSPQWLLRVFAPGTRSRPAFADPADVASWWVRTVPRETLVAMKPWPFPDYDLRDPRLHQLYVVAYAPDTNPDDQLGMFVTAVRDGYQGPWRFLEATVEP